MLALFVWSVPVTNVLLLDTLFFREGDSQIFKEFDKP